MPSQASMASTVVALSVAPLSPCSTGLAGVACTPSARAVRRARHALGLDPGVGGMIGAVGLMHLEADDLAAEQIEDEVEIEPSPLHLGRQERHVPAPDLTWAGRDMGARRA